MSKFKVDIKEFKRLYKKDVCSTCPKRIPCGTLDSICELVTPCQVCEIRDECKSLCPQMSAYLNRGVKGQPSTVPFSNNIDFSIEEESIRKQKLTLDDVPWEAIPEKAREVVIDHFKNGLTYSQVAKKHGISKGRAYKIVHGYGGRRQGAIDILKKYKTYQVLYKRFGHLIPKNHAEILKEYFIDYKTLKQISEEKGEAKNTTQTRFRKAKKLIDKFKR